ncbi:MAG: thiamine phosphate synthase [Candidatus Omnitrophica bacterium]|nr:thiamine phosphate synthase [Candidatus Omnitrophota bacterium]MBI2495777.1 thiamine phosphate synthase [Candidatus Omnitrophota bacterium]MBI3021564.1 thiamine phosphate synthase [Candidatus Omnitrophota bacterium]MBI3083630.1 thiamine phosphate synthase [Candidatus Omnitrophota bacterium]
MNVAPCSDWLLYVIVDRTAAGTRNLADLTAAAIRGGADVIQLRDKTASTPQLIEEAAALLPLTRSAGIPLIINDRVEVLRAVGADGVHLGQDDLPIAEARRLLGSERLIGQSTHSLEQALAAEAAGADYIGFGPIFPTPTKPDYASVGTALIGTVAKQVRLPLVCIGGIDRTTIGHVLEAGARCVAVVRAVCRAEDPEAATRALKRHLTQSVLQSCGNCP